ncbi:MAG: glycosyltransferase family 2 protein, partial [Desulfobacterales bacterium]|nr:glycosyltransferase family 2 protein [Desulfobacterales bacterium]
MYKDKSICVIVPAYNESTQIGKVLSTMPDFVDRVVVVDDASKDDTVDIVRQYQNKMGKIELIQHEINQGVGAAISSGYIRARDKAYDVTAVMAGDGQMDPDDLHKIIEPVVAGRADYA